MTRLLPICLLAGSCLTAQAATITTNVTFPVTYSYPDPTNCLPCPTCPPVTSYPPGPTNAAWTAVTSTNAILTWTDPTNAYTAIEVRFGNTVVATLPPTATSFAANGLSPVTTYTATVNAVFPGNTSAAVTTSNNPPTGLVAPTSLTVTSTVAKSLAYNFYWSGTTGAFEIRTNAAGAWNLTGFLPSLQSSNQYGGVMSPLPSGQPVTIEIGVHDANWANEVFAVPVTVNIQ